MSSLFYYTLMLVNLTCRVVVFAFFWWAYDDTDVWFGYYNYGFNAYVDAWKSQSIVSIRSIPQNTKCDPLKERLLTSYNLPQITAYGTYSEIMEDELNYWGLSNLATGFSLCGLLGNQSYLQTAQTTGNCTSKGFKDCGNITNAPFCVNLTDTCPIYGFTLSASGTNVVVTPILYNATTLKNTSQLPLSIVQIGTNGMCYQQNSSNIDLNEAYDPAVIAKQMKKVCDTIDPSYITVNSIPDSTYYKLNNVGLTVANDKIQKSLYYRQYPHWNTACYGSLFNLTFTIQSQLAETIRLSVDAYYVSVVDLLLLCYIFPGIPFMCRCIESLKIDKLIYIDSIIRIIFIAVMLYYSFAIIAQSSPLTSNLQEIIDGTCSLDQSNLSSQKDNIVTNITKLNIVAIYIALILSVFEIILNFLDFCSDLFAKCYNYLQKYKIDHSVKENDYALTQVQDPDHNQILASDQTHQQ